MGRKRKPDRLDIESKLATDAGMSYGKWKALQPPDEPKPPAKPKAMIEHVCALCGKTFYRHNKIRVKYCSPECQHEAYEEMNRRCRERFQEKHKEYQRLYQANYRKKDLNAVSKV